MNKEFSNLTKVSDSLKPFKEKLVKNVTLLDGFKKLMEDWKNIRKRVKQEMVDKRKE